VTTAFTFVFKQDWTLEIFQGFPPQEKSSGVARISFVYLALLVATMLVFFIVQQFGERLPAKSNAASPVVSGVVSTETPDLLPRALLALLVIVVTARFLGAACERQGQPRVIGEVIAGILLGPSLFGRIAPEGMAYIFPPGLAPILGFLAQLGVILYMFLVGLELNAGLLRSRAQATVMISHASILVPFLLGSLLALPAFTRYAGAGVSFTSFALFLGVAMSITAFPVLARILTDLKLDKTELGVIALGCAAADDLTAWCLLAFVVGIAKSDFHESIRTILLAGAYVCFMVAIARPVIKAWLVPRKDAALSTQLSAWILVAVLGSAMTTESIGIHAIFGAFLLGAVIPYDSHVAASFRHRLEDVVSVLLLPTFFAYTGTRTQIGLLSASQDWYFCLLIIGVATAGKFGGTLVASRFTGLDWRTSASLGTLMNTRGLMELIVLNIGLDLGVISPILFAMMVLMALVTTVATTPVLTRIMAIRAECPRHSE
jgi:Kef-type K+ transport system membrane component KefB